MPQQEGQDQPQSENLETMVDTHQSLGQNQQKIKENNWRYVLIVYILIFFFILIYSILLENRKQIEAPFNEEGKQCGFDEGVIDCPYSMQFNWSNKTSNICVKQCPDVSHYTYDCQLNQITTTVQLNKGNKFIMFLVDNFCIKEYQFLSSFNYFQFNIVYIPIIILTCGISFLVSQLLFTCLLKWHEPVRCITLIFMTIFNLGICFWYKFSSQTIIESEQFKIMIYILIYCATCYGIYVVRFAKNGYVQIHTFIRLSTCLYQFYKQMKHFRKILFLQFILLTTLLLLTYTTLSQISYLGQAVKNPDHQLSKIEYNYYQYIFIIISLYLCLFSIYFILGLGKLFLGIEICQVYFGLQRIAFIDTVKLIYKYHYGSIVLSALIQSFFQIPLFILQFIQYLINLIQLWFDENLRLSLQGIISYVQYCDDKEYLILAFTRLSIRESSNFITMLNKEYKFDKFHNPLTYNMLIQLFDIAVVGVFTFGIILALLIAININLYAQYVQFFWFIFLSSSIISNANLTYIQYILKSIILLIILDTDEESYEKVNFPQVIYQFHQFCNLQRLIFDEDNLLFKIDLKHEKLRIEQIQLQAANQVSQNLDNEILELENQIQIHEKYRDKLDEKYRKIVEITKKKKKK